MALFDNILKKIDAIAVDEFVALYAVDIDEVIIIDATMSINHGFRKEITNHPVEEGAEISDHIIDKAQPVTITGIISDDHISLYNSYEELTNILDDEKVSRSKRAYELFSTIKKTNSEMFIHTKYEDYENMYLQNFQINETPDIQNAIRFTATFKHVKLVKIKVGEASVDDTNVSSGGGSGKAKNMKDKGNQTKKPVTEANKAKVVAEQERSIAKSLLQPK